MAVCLFCDSAADWPTDIVPVLLRKEQEWVDLDRPKRTRHPTIQRRESTGPAGGPEGRLPLPSVRGWAPARVFACPMTLTSSGQAQRRGVRYRSMRTCSGPRKHMRSGGILRDGSKLAAACARVATPDAKVTLSSFRGPAHLPATRRVESTRFLCLRRWPFSR